MKKLFYFLAAFFALVGSAHAIDASKLLPAEQAFVPQVNATEQGINVQFAIAEGYYMYQSKMLADTAPAGLLAAPQFSPGEMKEDEFFGRQTVYHQAAQINWAYRQPAPPPYTLTLSYQGCAEVGVCYPPVETTFDIDGNGLYQGPDAAPASARALFAACSGIAPGQRRT